MTNKSIELRVDQLKLGDRLVSSACCEEVIGTHAQGPTRTAVDFVRHFRDGQPPKFGSFSALNTVVLPVTRAPEET